MDHCGLDYGVPIGLHMIKQCIRAVHTTETTSHSGECQESLFYLPNSNYGIVVKLGRRCVEVSDISEISCETNENSIK